MMYKIKALKEAAEMVKPVAEEEKEVHAKIKAFLDKLNKTLKGSKAVLGGSGAKNTWLRDVHDIDVFVQFDYDKFKDKSSELSDILEKMIAGSFEVKRMHGSRDYFQIKEDGFTFEVIPVLKISRAEQAMNITDASILHAKWVNKNSKYADDTRLMKQFCKALGIYGAESYIRGFSGYMCEILVIHYKGFMNAVKAAAKWKPQTVIDTAKFYKGKNDVLFNLNKSKIMGPLVLVDPVQKSRNAAAALGQENYDKFVSSCKAFARKPALRFFEIHEVTEDELKEKAGKNKLILVKAESLPEKVDVAGSKLLKVVEFLNQKLREKEFKVLDYGWKWNKEKNALFWFIVDPKKLDLYFIREGPPRREKIFVQYFKKKHKKTFVKKGKVCAKEKRPFREPQKFIEHLLTDPYVKEKVSSVNVV